MIAKIRKCQHDSSRFLFVAQSFTASVTGTSLIGGPSFAIQSKEFKVFSFIRFCTLALVEKNSFHIGCLNGNHLTYLCQSNHVGQITVHDESQQSFDMTSLCFKPLQFSFKTCLKLLHSSRHSIGSATTPWN